MDWGVADDRAKQHTLFLLDGLRGNPSPVLVVVGEQAWAAQVAQAVYNGSLPWDDRPERVGRLLQLDLGKIIDDPTGDFSGLLAELANTDHWIHLPNIDSLPGSPVGRRFLDGLMELVGGGELAALIASTTRKQLPQLNAGATRLVGFATTLEGPSDSGPGGARYTHSIVVQSNEPTDAGWVVAVRYELTGAIRQTTGSAHASSDGRLQLVETIHMIGRAIEHPDGVLIGLTPDAFTVSQEDAAFATAALAAERLVGRPLGAEEHVVAARAIFYS